MSEGHTTIVKIIDAAQQLGVTSFARAVLVFLSAGAIHTLGIALTVSVHAVPYLDFQSATSIAISLYASLVVAFLFSRMVNEVIGAEFAYKRFRRDRDAGRILLPKSIYIRDNEKTRASLELFFVPFIFIWIYIPGLKALAIAAAPFAFYFLVFLLHILWSWSNDFRRGNQSSAVERWLRILSKRKRFAFSFARLQILGWAGPRAVGLITMLLISTAIARTSYLERSPQVFSGQYGEITAAVVFRNTSGFVLSDSNNAKAWYLSNDGMLIQIDASNRPWWMGGDSTPE